MNNILLSSKSVEWETPQYIYDLLNLKYNFTLDPCATINNHKCEKFYTISENGLMMSWKGERVFCNPPYGRKLIDWICKGYNEYFFNNVFSVFLVPARVDTKWFHRYVLGKANIYFFNKRLRFNDSKQNCTFPYTTSIHGNVQF